MLKKIRSRLSTKLMVYFSCIIAVTTISVTAVSYVAAIRQFREHVIEHNMNLLRLLNHQVESYFGQLESLSLTFRRDSTFMNYLQLEPEGFFSQNYYEQSMKSLFYSRDDFQELDLFIPETRRSYTVSRFSKWTWTIEEHEAFTYGPYHLEAMESMRNQSIQPHAYEDQSGYIRVPNDYFLTYYRILIDITDKLPLGVITITLNADKMDEIFLNTNYRTHETVLLMGHDGMPVFIHGNGALHSSFLQKISDQISGLESSPGHFTISYEGQSHLVLSDRLPRYDMDMVKIIPYQYIAESARRAGTINLFIGGLFVVISIYISIYVSRAITNPLNRLSRNMETIGKGSFNVKTEITGSDEIAMLSRQFNLMSEEIQSLIQKEYLSKINEKNARIKALQAQLDPHYLYNSLQTISTKALVHKADDIHRMVALLSDTLRYLLKDESTVTIGNEVEHVKKYLAFQQERFGNQLQGTFNVSDAVCSWKIPKLLLQLLVENSIKHGLGKIEKILQITIHAYRSEDSIIIYVHDNGPGIKPQHMRTLQDVLTSKDYGNEFHDHIGLVNLSSRLHLLYGESAEVRIDSTEGAWTKVTIILPTLKEL